MLSLVIMWWLSFPGEWITLDLHLAIQLYIGDLEIANPLGTSHKVYKLCAVYWVPPNVPLKYRLAMHTIQLVVLAKVTDLQKYGYAATVYLLYWSMMFTHSNRMVFSFNLLVRMWKAPFSVFLLTIRFCMATSEQFQATEVKKNKKKKLNLSREQKVVMTFLFKMSSKTSVQADNLGLKVVVSCVSHLIISTHHRSSSRSTTWSLGRNHSSWTCSLH